MRHARNGNERNHDVKRDEVHAFLFDELSLKSAFGTTPNALSEGTSPREKLGANNNHKFVLAWTLALLGPQNSSSFKSREILPRRVVGKHVSDDLKAALKTLARERGFVACGVASASPSQSTSRLESWLANNFEASMSWMKRPDAVEKRADIEKLFPGARSVVSLAFPYATDESWNAEEMGHIARYARGLDYHDFLPTRIRELLSWIQTQVPCNGKVCVDTAPVLEREWAVRAGIGWIGKNTLLMGRDFG